MFILKPSFAAGELSPALYGRTDLAKYDIGAASLVNFLVLRYGGIRRRPGLKHIAKTRNNLKARLIPFNYSKNDNYVIEVTPGGFRFYKDGNLVTVDENVLEAANSYVAEDLADLKYTQSADMLFLTSPSHYPSALTRNSNRDWTFSELDIEAGPFEDANVKDIKISASDVVGDVTLTASVNYFTSDMEGQLIRLGHTMKSQYQKLIPESPGPKVISSAEVLCPPNGTVYVETFGFWSGMIKLQKYDDETSSWIDIRVQDNNHNSNYNFTETNDSNAIKKYRLHSDDFDNTVWSGENNKQYGYAVIQCFAGGYYGIAQINKVNSATSATATIKRRLADTAGTTDFAMQAWSDTKGYPHCAGFYEDRLVFAGSRRFPQTYWLSKTGDYLNFDVSVPQVDDDAITGTLNNGQMNGIRAMVAFGELLMLTEGGEYKLSGGNNPITPSNQNAKNQEYRGINNLLPVVCGGRVVYVQQMGSIVRDFAYSYEQDKYTGDDVSLLASHLFEGHTIVSIAYQQTPNSIVWCVRDDGVLLGMTYIKEQDVYAWHRHTTQGRFVDVCCISGDAEDNAYFVVERDGNYYVEMMASQIDTDDEKKQYFMDSYVEVTNTNVIEGLERFNGKTVQILCDGSVMPPMVVENGRINLNVLYHDRVIVGLGYESELETMPIEFNGNDGTFLSRKKRLSKLMILFKNSRGGLFGCKGNRLAEIKWRTGERYGDSIKLKTGKQYVVPPSTWTDTLSVVVKQEDPLPMSILSIVPEIVAGG